MKFNFLNKKSDKVKNQYAFKKTVFSSAFIIFVVVALLLLNILSIVLYENFPLEIDLTNENVYSLSDKSIDFIKSIEDEVTVYVWADEQSMTNGNLESYFQSNFYYYDQTGKYFSQLKKNIDAYNKYNEKIKIKYIDVSSPTAADIKSKFPNEYIYAGDLLVTANITIDGKQTEKQKHLNAYDLLTAEYDNSTSYYTINGSDLENQLGSAINYVTERNTTKVAFLSGIGDIAVLSSLKENLELNTYTVDEVKNIQNIQKYDIAVIASHTKDLTETELDLLDSFLDNGGKKGKVLSVFGNPAGADTPNFDEFLEEWGIAYGEGTVVETDENYHYPNDPYTFFYTPETTEYTSSIPADMYLVAAQNSPLEVLFESKNNRTTTIIANSNETSAIRPKNAPDGWKPKESDIKAIPLGIVSQENVDSKGSVVLAFSSTDLAASDWLQYSAVANMDYLVNSFKFAYEKNSDGLTFINRTITNSNFASDLTAQGSKFITVLFVYISPIAVIVIGVIVFIKRKNR